MAVSFKKVIKVKITMTAYNYGLISEAPANVSNSCPTPAAIYFFETSVDLQRPDTNRATLFLLLVAKACVLSKRPRPDIQLAMAFFCTRLRESDKPYRKKICREIQYFCGAKDLASRLKKMKASRLSSGRCRLCSVHGNEKLEWWRHEPVDEGSFWVIRSSTYQQV